MVHQCSMEYTYTAAGLCHHAGAGQRFPAGIHSCGAYTLGECGKGDTDAGIQHKGITIY